MRWLTVVNARLSRWAMYLAVTGLFGIVCVVVWGVVKRYVFDAPQPYVEQVALLLVIVVAMFGAAAGVRDEGHIGMESLVGLLPERPRFAVGMTNGILTCAFGLLLTIGSLIMASSVFGDTIPALGISEAFRYLPGIVAGPLVVLFSVEHLAAMVTRTKVVPSWN